MRINPDLATTSVNDVLRLAPASLDVFNRFGLDTCCGGGLALREAARNAGVELDALLDALAPLLVGAGGSAREGAA